MKVKVQTHHSCHNLPPSQLGKISFGKNYKLVIIRATFDSGSVHWNTVLDNKIKITIFPKKFVEYGYPKLFGQFLTRL